jgi:hypothetical protein
MAFLWPMLCVARHITSDSTASASKSIISAQTCRTAKQIRSDLFTKVSLSKEYGVIIARTNVATNGAEISFNSGYFHQ